MIGIRHDYTFSAFATKGMMKPLRAWCFELVLKDCEKYKLFLQFLNGVKILGIDNIKKLKKQIISAKKVCIKNRKFINEKVLSQIEEEAVMNWLKKQKYDMVDFFSSVEYHDFFLDIFIDVLNEAIDEKDEVVSIGNMFVRPDHEEEYGWDYPNKIVKLPCE